MDDETGMALDAVCPVFVVVYLVAIECQGREAEQANGRPAQLAYRWALKSVNVC